MQSIIDTGLISLNENFKIYWNDFPIAKLTTGSDYLNPNFDLIVDDIIEQSTKQKLNDYINKWLHSKINNVLKSLIDLKNIKEIINVSDKPPHAPVSTQFRPSNLPNSIYSSKKRKYFRII